MGYPLSHLSHPLALVVRLDLFAVALAVMACPSHGGLDPGGLEGQHHYWRLVVHRMLQLVLGPIETEREGAVAVLVLRN